MSTPRKGDWIQTYTLRQFWPMDPRPEEVCLDDIVHALSNQCRFSGHLGAFYSVAQHCVEVSLLAEQTVRREVRGQYTEPAALACARWGLFHDASEAYLVDVPRPIKHLPEMAPYREAEADLQRVICRRFGLPLFEPGLVKEADRRMCATEARDLFSGPLHPAWEQPAEPLPTRIRPLSPRQARDVFWMRFAELWPGGAP